MIRYQGESIDFNIALNESSSIQQWSDFSIVCVYLYTNTSRIVKFSSVKKSDKESMTISEDGKILSGTLQSKDTKTMKGALYMDILGKTGEDKVYIRRICTSIDIQYAPIKAEL